MPAYASSGSGTGWKPRSVSWAEISAARSGDLASTTRACGPQPMIVMLRTRQNARAESSHGGCLERDKRDIEEVYETGIQGLKDAMIPVFKLALRSDRPSGFALSD